MKYPKSNEQDLNQSGNAEFPFSLKDLIEVNNYYDVYPDDISVYDVAELGSDQVCGLYAIEDYISVYDISKTVHPHIEDLNRSDINRLKGIISSTLNNYKGILEQSPEQVLKLIEILGKQTEVINRELMVLYEEINQILQKVNPEANNPSILSEETFFEILNEEKLIYSIFSKNSLSKQHTEKLETILCESIVQHLEIKCGYMRLCALQRIQNNYHSYLFQDKMEELEEKCLQIITKKKIEEVKRELDFLTSEGRYKIFRNLTSEHKRKDAVVILEKELVSRYGYELHELRESPDSYDPADSHKAFLNAYDAWNRNNKDKT